MTKEADFNAEEWSPLLEAPPIAGMIVAVAERGGMIGRACQWPVPTLRSVRGRTEASS
jgi:hypothetical protein